MKIKINEDICIGCGICMNICPEGIEMMDRKARVKNENASCLKDAAGACYTKDINIKDEEDKSENMSLDDSYDN